MPRITGLYAEMDPKVIRLRPPPDRHLAKMEEDRDFWLAEMKRATKEYMAVCWKIAVYKQGR